MKKCTKVWWLFFFVFCIVSPIQTRGENFEKIFLLRNEFELQQTKDDSIGYVGNLRVAPDWCLYLVDQAPSQCNVKVYDSKGKLIKVIGKRKEDVNFGIPTDVTFSPQHRVFVSDLGGKINVLDSSGNFLFNFAEQQDTMCRSVVWNIKIDSKGNVYIGGSCVSRDFSNFQKLGGLIQAMHLPDCPKRMGRYCLHKYSPNGQYIASFLPFGKKWSELCSVIPEWTCFDFDVREDIWCVQTMIDTIFNYSPDGKLLKKFPQRSSSYKPPTKFNASLDMNSLGAYEKWENSWTQLINCVVTKEDLVIVQLWTHSPSHYVVSIYNTNGELLYDIPTQHRLLGKDVKDNLYFLLEGDFMLRGESANRKVTIGVFSLSQGG